MAGLGTRWCPWVMIALVAGCGTTELPPDDDGGSTSSGTTGVSTDGSASQTSAVDGTGSGDGASSGGTAACESGGMGYVVVAEVLDEGLGPTGAPVTIDNCTDAEAFVRQDCCYGAAFMLERKDFADDPWRTSAPAMDCDCEGFVEPLMIPPWGSVVVDTNPASFDAEPLCQEPFVAIYRWTFEVGDQAECADCWQQIPTNEMNWYCEG